jgi:hypothetical protein
MYTRRYLGEDNTEKSLLSPGGANYSLPKLLLRGPVDGPAIVTIVTKKKREE